MISNSPRVGMATFPHELPGSVLKIGLPEVRQADTQAVWSDASAAQGGQHHPACSLRVVKPLPFPSRPVARSLRQQIQKHPSLKLETLARINTPAFPHFTGGETDAQRG